MNVLSERDRLKLWKQLSVSLAQRASFTQSEWMRDQREDIMFWFERLVMNF